MSYIRRKDGDFYSVRLLDQGKKLLCTQFQHHSHRFNRFNDFKEHCCFIDIYDLDTLCLINSIPLNAEPRTWLQKNVLVLSFWSKIEVWDILQPCLLSTIRCNQGERSLDLNQQANKIIIATDDAMIWNLYEPTLKQLLLKQLLLNWCLLKRQLHIFDSVNSLLSTIANLFANKVKKNGSDQELEALKEDLFKTWYSFPEFMQNTMWRTLQQKMKRNREYALPLLSVRIKETRKTQKNKQTLVLQPEYGYIPAQKTKKQSYPKNKKKNKNSGII